MNQLKLVWELEIHNTTIDESKREVNRLENDPKLKDMKEEIKKTELELNSIEDKIKKDNGQVIKLERLLKEYDYTKNKLENDLYNGSISDLKQLEQMTIEKDKMINLIDQTESNILKLIDDMEDQQLYYNRLKEDHSLLKIEISKIQDDVYERIKNLEEKISNSQKEKTDLLIKIEEKILNRYEITRSKRGRGIVPSYDDICGGCNVRIPTYLLHDLKMGSKIIYCESCGRLLYYTEDQMH